MIDQNTRSRVQSNWCSQLANNSCLMVLALEYW
jgi:hypothetical protein